MLLHLVLLHAVSSIVLTQEYYGGYGNSQPVFSSSYPQQYNQAQMYPPPQPQQQQQQQQYYNPPQQNQPMIQPYQAMAPGAQYQQSQQYQPSGQSYQTIAPPTSRPYQPTTNSQGSGAQWATSRIPSQNGSAQSGTQRDDQQKDCRAPRIPGDFCNSAQQRQMFYYDSITKLCQPFMYNGCNGNGNRFETAAECKSFCLNNNGTNGSNQPQRDDSASLQQAMAVACRGEYAVDHLTPRQCGNNGQQCPTGYQCSSQFCCPASDYLCNLRYDSGKFAVNGVKSDRYFYTDQYKTCMRFSFYGTLGNENNFLDYNSCMRTCGSQQQQ